MESAMDEVLVEIEDGLVVITINRPQAKNAVNRAVSLGVCAAVDLLDARDDLRVGGQPRERRRRRRQQHRADLGAVGRRQHQRRADGLRVAEQRHARKRRRRLTRDEAARRSRQQRHRQREGDAKPRR